MSEIKKPSMKLQSDRITFKVRAADQSQELFEMIARNREHLRPWMPWEKRTEKVEDTQSYIKMILQDWSDGKTFDYSMFETKSGKMIGSFGLHSINWAKKTCHLGYWIDKNFEGRGYVSESIRYFEKVAKDLGFHRMVITCDADNKRSIATAKKNNFKKEALLIDESLSNGKFRDTFQFVKFLTDNALPSGFNLKTNVTRDEFVNAISDAHDRIFKDEDLRYDKEKSLSEPEVQKLKKLNKDRPSPLTIRTLLYFEDKIAGWIWGYQDNYDSFYLTNAAILPEFRRKGLFSFLLKSTSNELIEMGFQKLWSRHSLMNNSVLIAMMKNEFHITTMELSDTFGTLLHMAYFPNEMRTKVMQFRSGELRPDKKLKDVLEI